MHMLNTYGPTCTYTFLHSFDPGSKDKCLLTFTVKSKEECRYRKTLLNCINLVYMYACTIVYTLWLSKTYSALAAFRTIEAEEITINQKWQ